MTDNSHEITLHDVIAHLQKMSHDHRIQFRKIDNRLGRIEHQIVDLKLEVTANHEDLCATMMDVAKVRKKLCI